MIHGAAKIATGTIEASGQVAPPAIPERLSAVQLHPIVVWIGWCIVLLLPAAVAAVALKWFIVVDGELPRLAAMMFRTPASITFAERSTFLRSDLLLGLLVLPVVL